MSTPSHHTSAQNTQVRCAVLTVSDTRTPETDTSGALMRSRLTEAGFVVQAHAIVPDDGPRILALLEEWVDQVDAILLNGGTGISPRDGTFEAVSGILDKTLPGFGEIFRMLSYEEVGAAAMLSRAVAGLYRGTFIFSTPGSTNAVKLAMDKLIIPELKHLVWETGR